MKPLISKQIIKNFLLHCGLPDEAYRAVRPQIWQRNLATLRITSAMASVMGLLFMLINLGGNWVPYLFLFVGAVIVLALQSASRGRDAERWGLPLCYAQMLLLCAYATVLSMQAKNYAIPGVSVIVFIVALPQSIDDRPARMYAFMLFEAALYLAVSRLSKSNAAFGLDVVNVVPFLIIGMILYAVICSRNVRELYQSLRVERLQREIISSLATVVEERDESTGGHIQRTENYVRLLTERMRALPQYARLGEDYWKNVMLAAAMHDIGKIKIPDQILNKPGRLTEEEYEIMKQHAAYGADIIQRTMRNVEEADYFNVAYNIARYHHERYDGKGYPDGLSGEGIPLEARIMALADVYDALISERVYKKAFPTEKAQSIIAEGEGTQFDPFLTKLFLECLKEK